MMDESIASQISEKRRAMIDALSKDELRFEIERGSSSRVQGLTAYMKLRLAKLVDDEATAARRVDVSIAREAIRLSKIAIGVSIAALVASAIAWIVAAD